MAEKKDLESTEEAEKATAVAASEESTSDAQQGKGKQGKPGEIDLNEVDKLLNAKGNEKDLPKNMQRLIAREKENNKRVEESIKGAKTNPSWFVPLFCFLMILGLLWVVVYYIDTQRTGGVGYPIPAIGNWNLLVGFVILLIGFLMTMWWN